MITGHLTASAAVIDPATGTVLLVWHNASGLWMLPGGHLDDGESPAEAALREVREEAGVVASLVEQRLELPGMTWQPSPYLTAVIPAPAKPDRPGKPAEAAHWHIDLLFAATGDSTRPTSALLSEVAQVQWQPIGRLKDLQVRAEVPQVVALACELIARTSGSVR